MGVGILISSYPRGQSMVQVNLKFHGVDSFDIILPLWTVQINLQCHGGGNFDNVFPAWTFNINLKFHGGGNFDIIVFPTRVENVKWKTGNCISVFPLLLCSWPVRVGFCLMPLHHKQTSGFTLKPQKISGGITRLIHPTRRSYQLTQKESKKRVQVWNSPLLKESQPRPPGSSGPWVAYVSVLRRLELDPKELGPIVWSSRRAHRNLKWEKASLTGSWRSGQKPVKWGWVSPSAHWL